MRQTTAQKRTIRRLQQLTPELTGIYNCECKSRKRTLKNARIVISRDGKRSLIGRDWLNQLNFRVGDANGND